MPKLHKSFWRLSISPSLNISLRSNAAKTAFFALLYCSRPLSPTSFTISAGSVLTRFVFSWGQVTILSSFNNAALLMLLMALMTSTCFRAFPSPRIGGYLLPAGTAATVDVRASEVLLHPEPVCVFMRSHPGYFLESVCAISLILSMGSSGLKSTPFISVPSSSARSTYSSLSSTKRHHLNGMFNLFATCLKLLEEVFG